jgi:sugar lactone lactonase YvrE
MTTDGDLDRQIQDYLQSGPPELPDRVLWAARAQLTTTRRRRARFGWLTPWREIRMSQSTRLLVTAGAALVVFVAIGAGILGTSSRNSTGQQPSASPVRSSQPTSPTSSSDVAPGASTVYQPPVFPARSPSPLAAVWESAGGAATRFGGLEVAPDGRIWVPSAVDNTIRIFASDGKLSETWGTPGSGDGQFNFNIGSDNAGALVFAPDGGFFVLDSGNFRVERFDKDRKFLGAWGRYGSGAGEFVLPTDIDIDMAGSIFVSDDRRHDIQVFTSDGTYRRSVAVGIAGPFISATGEGWVTTDRLQDGRSGIVEYKPDGSHGGGYDMTAVMSEATGITRDQQGDLFIVGLTASGDGSALVRLAPGGSPQTVWDAGGLGVAVSPSGDIAYVLRSDNATIRKYVLPKP